MFQESGNRLEPACDTNSQLSKPAQQSDDVPMCVCHFSGALADHLRGSDQCVAALRRDPLLLQMKASKELFIVKATLILGGCPARECPGGTHRLIPNHCISWWREIGWGLMSWIGPSTSAESGTIKGKIGQFRRNFRRRNKNVPTGSSQGLRKPSQTDSSQQSDQEKNQTTDGVRNHCCQFCSYKGLLIGHLHQAKGCLNAYLQRHLPNRAHMYREKTRQAVFDLGLVCMFCVNPKCGGSLENEGLAQHLGGPCLDFYQTEVSQVLNWTQHLSLASFLDKLKFRKSWVKNYKGNVRCVQSSQQELAYVLRFVCSKCSLQGPLLDSRVHTIWGAGVSLNADEPLWECVECRGSDEIHQDLVEHAVERVVELGSATEFDDSLKKVVVQGPGNERQRVVFVPASVLLDSEAEAIEVKDEEMDPNCTTIVVPRYPEALEQIGDDATERANSNKKQLERLAEFYGRRHFSAPVTETLTVFYKLKLAQIRVERLIMLKTLKKTGKGKIISRDPNLADVKDRKPHYAETQKFCLTNTCSWSPAAQAKRSKESAGRAFVDGQVKIKVDITVLKKLAVDSPLLNNIIFGINSSAHGPVSLISLAPSVLNFLKAKLKVMVKHVVSPTFSNWDLELMFAKQDWTVKLVGFLYCQEFEELNRRIACSEMSSKEIAKEVRKHPSMLPTTALSVERIMRDYSITDDRAQVRIFEEYLLKRNFHH